MPMTLVTIRMTELNRIQDSTQLPLKNIDLQLSSLVQDLDGVSVKVCSDFYSPSDENLLPVLTLGAPDGYPSMWVFMVTYTPAMPASAVQGCNFVKFGHSMQSQWSAWWQKGPNDWYSVAGDLESSYLITAFTDYLAGPSSQPSVLTEVDGTPWEVGFNPGIGSHPSIAQLYGDPRRPVLVYQQDRIDNGDSIMFTRRDSPDNWVMPYAIVGSAGGMSVTNKTPELAVDTTGRIHVAYIRSSPGEPGAVYYLRNMNRGDNASWEPEPGRRLSQATTLSHDIAIAASRDGSTIIVVWTATVAGNDDLMYAYSMDGGGTFSSALNLSATSFNEGYPAISVDPDTSTFHVAYWRDDSMPGRTNNILYTQASWADPANWTTPLSVLDAGSAVSPTHRRPGIASYTYQGNHTVNIAWTDVRNATNPDIYMTAASPISCHATANPLSVEPGAPVSFAATASGGTSPYSYFWRFGDGATDWGPSVSHSYAVPGQYNVVLRVDDIVGNTCFDALRIDVLSPAPDLVVSPADVSFSPISPFAEGTTTRINVTVHNIGGAVSNATVARFFDGVPPSPQMGTDRPLPPIPVNGSANVSVMWTVSPPGSHDVCVMADPDNLVAEMNETNNVACVPVQVLSLPDLIPRDLNITPSSPIFEDTMSRINVTVSNEGDMSAGTFGVLLFDDRNGDRIPDAGEQVNVSASSGLVGHSQSEFIFDWNAAPAGSHSMCVYADPPSGTVSESNETNNVACMDIIVQPGPVLRPDYVPISPLPLPPIRVGMSSPVSLSIEVLNQGNGTAIDNAIVAFREQSSPPISTSVLNPLAPATTSSRFTATWTSPAMPGTYLVSVDIDYYDNVSEWDETNNVYTWTIEVVAGPITSLVIGNPNCTSTATYVKSVTPLDFSVIDQSGLGIRNTTYTIDGGNPVNYTATGTFFLAGEGAHTVEWRSLDWAGNLEEISSMYLTVDDTPPATTIHQSDEQATTATVFTLTATDSGCGVNVTKYRIDGGSWAVYSGGFTLPEGLHNISYLSNDMLNNTERERWLVVNVSGPQVPPIEVAVNYKPIVAVMFAIILLVAGICSSKRRPWKGRKDRMAVVKAFILTPMPFVAAEAATGVISFLTGGLSIPPVVGVGMAVDCTILILGLIVLVARAMKKKTGTEEAPAR